MAELKTKAGDGDVEAWLAAIADPARQADCRAVVKLMGEVTGEAPRLWGPTIAGFGRYTYRYETGRTGDWFLTGVAPRKQALTLYVMDGFAERDALMGRLGKHTTGKACLYIKRLSDVDGAVLREILERSVAALREKYPSSADSGAAD